MTISNQIKELIVKRENGDLTAQSKIDALFSNIKETPASAEAKQESLIAQSNALAAQG